MTRRRGSALPKGLPPSAAVAHRASAAEPLDHQIEAWDTISAGANVLAVSRMLGHENPQVTLKTYADFNRDFVNAVREAKKSGKSVDDVVSSWKVPDKYTGLGVFCWGL